MPPLFVEDSTVAGVCDPLPPVDCAMKGMAEPCGIIVLLNLVLSAVYAEYPPKVSCCMSIIGQEPLLDGPSAMLNIISCTVLCKRAP